MMCTSGASVRGCYLSVNVRRRTSEDGTISSNCQPCVSSIDDSLMISFFPHPEVSYEVWGCGSVALWGSCYFSRRNFLPKWGLLTAGSLGKSTLLCYNVLLMFWFLCIEWQWSGPLHFSPFNVFKNIKDTNAWVASKMSKLCFSCTYCI